MDISDKGSGYESLVEGLRRMRDAVRPCKVPAARRKRADLLKIILGRLVKVARNSAITKRWGLAKSLHAEFSGLAGLGVLKRVEAALNASCKEEAKWNNVNIAPEPAAPVSHASGGNGGGGGGRGGGGGGQQSKGGGGANRNPKGRYCYNCGQPGHYVSRCPDKAKPV